MSKKYILAIDQSTQGTKAILVDQNNQIFWKAALPHKQIINNQKGLSHDPGSNPGNHPQAAELFLYRRYLKH